MQHLHRHRSLFVAAALAVVGLCAIAAVALRERLEDSASQIADANPLFLVAAAVLFAGSLLMSAQAWRHGLRAVADAPISPMEASARYAVGSLANSVLPFHAGSAMRIALFARVVGDVRAVAAVVTAIGSVGALGAAILVASAAGFAGLPLWPAALLLAGAIGSAALSLVAARSVLRNGRLAGSVIGALALRIVGVSALLAAYGVHHAMPVGVLVVVSLEIAGVVALTPGNVGVSTAAITVVLAARGVGDSLALTIGIALPTCETAVAVALGVAGVAFLARQGERPVGVLFRRPLAVEATAA